MPDASLQAVVDAINDLTRITIAVQGDFASRSEAVRRLSELNIPANRIAGILAMSTSDVTSALAKAKKAAAKRAGSEAAGPLADAPEGTNA